MAIENVTLFSAQGGFLADATQESAAQTGGMGKFIRNIYVDFDEGSGTTITVTLRIRVTDPVDGASIFLTGQSAPNTDSVIFSAYDLSGNGSGILKKWIAVGADIANENNNGFLMLPTDGWDAQITLGGTPVDGAGTTIITLIAQLDDGLS